MKIQFAILGFASTICLAASCNGVKSKDKNSSRDLSMCDCIKAEMDQDSLLINQCYTKFNQTDFTPEEQEKLKKEAIRCAEKLGLEGHKEKATLEIK